MNENVSTLVKTLVLKTKTFLAHLVIIEAARNRHGEEIRGHHTCLQVKLHGS